MTISLSLLSDQETKTALVKLLRLHFSLREIQELCFNLNVPYDNLEGGEAIASKVQALVEYMDRRLQLADLIEAAHKERPKVIWPTPPEQTIPVSFEPTLDNTSSGRLVLPTGYTDLDALIDGYYSSTLNVVAARPSMGKTSFVTSIALVAARRYQARVIFFSLQMANQLLRNRIIALQTGIEPRSPLTNLSASKLALRQLVLTELTQTPLLLVDSPFTSLEQLDADLRIRKADRPLDLLVIDGLEQIIAQSGNGNKSVWTGINSPQWLKHLAMHYNCPVIATLQLGSELDREVHNRPRLNDLHDNWAFIADSIVSIYRDDYYDPTGSQRPNIAEIDVLKNRNGPLGTIDLFWYQRSPEFRNLHRVEIDL